MAKNFVKECDRLTDPSLASAVTSGEAVAIGDTLGIASCDGEIGDAVDFMIKGGFTLPAVSADVLAIGAIVNWSAANGVQLLTGDLDGSCRVMEASGNGDTTVVVEINP